MGKKEKKHKKNRKEIEEILFNIKSKKTEHVIMCKRCGQKLTYKCIVQSCEPPKIEEVVNQVVDQDGDNDGNAEDDTLEAKVWKFFESKNMNYVLCKLCEELLYIGGLSKHKPPSYKCYSTKKDKNNQMYIMKRHLNLRHGLTMNDIQQSNVEDIKAKEKELGPNAQAGKFPLPNFEYWHGQGCIVYVQQEESDDDDEDEEASEASAETETPKMVMTKEQLEIEKFLAAQAAKEKDDKVDFRQHDDFNFQAVFKKSVKEPTKRLIY